MKYLRPLLLALSTLTLLAACSQPEDLQPVEPQFGTWGNDYATAVSVAPTGIVTKGVSLEAKDGKRVTVYLRQLDSSSRLVRELSVGTFTYASLLNNPNYFIEDLETDAQGNVYGLLGYHREIWEVPVIATTLYKFGSKGKNLSWKKSLDTTLADLNSSTFKSTGFDLDKNGNIYVIQGDTDVHEGEITRSYFTRYNPNGVRGWTRDSQVGQIRDLVVAGSGDMYIVGEKGLSRYSNSGSLLWTKALPGIALAVSGSHLYLNSDSELLKLKLDGTRVWAKPALGSLEAADTRGNVYVQTRIERSSVVRKVSPSGNLVWEKALKFGASSLANDIHDVATYNGDNVYAVGITDGPVNGVNHGGLDAFIVRLNAQGQKVWER